MVQDRLNSGCGVGQAAAFLSFIRWVALLMNEGLFHFLGAGLQATAEGKGSPEQR